MPRCNHNDFQISKVIADVLHSNESFWNSFDNLIIYHNNGQIKLTKILTSVFSTLYSHVEFRKVRPMDYKLFQVANLICTMELLEEKAATNSFIRSEMDFFGNVRDFKKNYLKHLQKKYYRNIFQNFAELPKFNRVFIFGTVLVPLTTIILLQRRKKAPRAISGSLDFTE